MNENFGLIFANFVFSEQIMDPVAPQALRLQAILASGVVILHERQCNFLREDVEHVIVGFTLT